MKGAIEDATCHFARRIQMRTIKKDLAKVIIMVMQTRGINDVLNTQILNAFGAVIVKLMKATYSKIFEFPYDITLKNEAENVTKHSSAP